MCLGRRSQRQPRQAPPVPASVSADDARFAITAFAGWITNADTKTGLLAAAVTVLTSTVVSQSDRAIALLPPQGVRQVAAVVAIVACLAALAVTAFWLLRALLPRTTNAGFSRYSWPAVAALSPRELVAMTAIEDRAEAWLQAHTLARIAQAKFGNFAHALRWFTAAVVLLIAWAILAP